MDSTRRKIGIATIVLVVLSLASLAVNRASAGDSDETMDKSQITIQDFSFQPMALTVPVGAKVTWINRDEEPHTVFSTDSTFKSKALDTGDQFSFTFDKPGTYEYFCSVHPKMTGKIIVK